MWVSVGFWWCFLLFFFRKKTGRKTQVFSFGTATRLVPGASHPAQALEQRQEDEDLSLLLCTNQDSQARGTCPPKHLLEAVLFINTVPNFPGIRPLVASVTFWVQEQIHILSIRRMDVCGAECWVKDNQILRENDIFQG